MPSPTHPDDEPRESGAGDRPPAGVLVGPAALYAIVWLNFYDQLAFLPLLSPHAEALGATALGVGAIVAAYSLASAVGNGVAGPAVDRLGRWPLIAGSFAVMAVTAAAHAAVARPETLLALRAAHGFAGGAVMPAAFALLADLGGGRRQGRRMGHAGSAITLAAVIAPPVSGTIADRFGFGGAAFTVSALLASGAALAALVLPRLERATRSARGGRQHIDARPAPVPWRRLSPIYGGAFLIMFGQGVVYFALPLQAQAIGLTRAATGGLFTAFAAGALVAFIPPLSRLGERIPHAAGAAAGLCVAAASHLALAHASAMSSMLAAMGALGLGFGLVFTALGAWLAEATSPSSRGRAFGAYYAIFSLGAITGAVAAGIAAPHTSPFVSSAGVIAAGIAVPLAVRAYARRMASS